MRRILVSERKKRGCDYCNDVIPPVYSGKTIRRTRRCPYDECPHHELDKVKSYDEYLKKTKGSGLVRVLEALGKE